MEKSKSQKALPTELLYCLSFCWPIPSHSFILTSFCFSPSVTCSVHKAHLTKPPFMSPSCCSHQTHFSCPKSLCFHWHPSCFPLPTLTSHSTNSTNPPAFPVGLHSVPNCLHCKDKLLKWAWWWETHSPNNQTNKQTNSSVCVTTGEVWNN